MLKVTLSFDAFADTANFSSPHPPRLKRTPSTTYTPVGSVLVMPPAAGEVVDDEDVVPAGRESHRRGPPQVAIAAEDQDSHGGAA